MSGVRQAIFPVPEGPWPKGKAWYPLLGTWGPVGPIGDDGADGLLFAEDADRAEKDDNYARNPHLWRTLSGAELPITELTTSHLRNILRLIERKNGPLAKVAARNERTRNLLAEFLKRF